MPLFSHLSIIFWPYAEHLLGLLKLSIIFFVKPEPENRTFWEIPYLVWKADLKNKSVSVIADIGLITIPATSLTALLRVLNAHKQIARFDASRQPPRRTRIQLTLERVCPEHHVQLFTAPNLAKSVSERHTDYQLHKLKRIKLRSLAAIKRRVGLA